MSVRGVLPVILVSLGCVLLWCGDSFADVPLIRPTRGGETPFVQVEEFVPGAVSVSAELYAFMDDKSNPKLTTSVLEYVDAADYHPGAKEPYVAGVTISFGEASNTFVELHAHLVLEPDTVYHYRIVASNSEGSVETPDQTFQTFPPSQTALPDDRAYEQVSPPAKNGLDAIGNGLMMNMQAADSGAAFAFFSFEPFPLAVGTSYFFTEYFSSRSAAPAEWVTQGVQAPRVPLATDGGENTVSGFTEDLAKAIIKIGGRPSDPPGVINAYVRDNTTGAYQLLAADVGGPELLFVDATRDDSRILFETETQLLPAAAAGKTNLYEWDENKPEGKRLSLAGVLPDAECAAPIEPSGCAPPNGSGAGPGGNENQSKGNQNYLQNTISEDGSKVFFTAHPSGRIYEREPLAEPSPVTVPVSPGGATFLAATQSGRYVFYAEGSELYRFDTVSETRQALTNGAEGVLGDLGVSDDGSYAYFVAEGVIATDENANGEEAVKGAPNLYVWHEDPETHTAAITFITRLLPAESTGDESDWFNTDRYEEGKTSRVNPSGTALLFTSRASLTGYDNGSLGSSACSIGGLQTPCQEVFLYTAGEPLSSTNPVCVSCNPLGGVATSTARLAHGEQELELKGPAWGPHLTRNLSVDGGRVFFETAESLVPGDVNGVNDVYEWERGGIGSCPAGNDHCLYLISTGTAHAKSYFGDASASGDDVFFFTRQPLVAQDGDLNFDVYDARVGGGIPAQDRSVAVCEGEEGCRPALSSAPVFGVPGSVTLTGGGNLLPPPPPRPLVVSPVKCAKNQKLTHGKCVVVKCAKGHKLNHGRCVKVKVKGKSKARARKAIRPTRWRSK